MTRGKIVLDGKSKENLRKENTVLLSGVLILGTVRTYPKLKQQQKIRFRRRVALFEQKRWLLFGQ